MNNKIIFKITSRILFLISVCISFFLITASFSLGKKLQPIQKGTLKIVFINTANGKLITLRDSIYSNYFGEQYHINKLKYYVSNIILSGKQIVKYPENYYLVNAASDDNSFELTIPQGNYNNLEFLLGVDSSRNCSGAQTGALDPMNDMFWTWNSGYVMFKLEGNSPASAADLQRIEHHIGGYKGANNVATKINFNFSIDKSLEIKANNTTEILIETNLDNYWHGKTDIKISELALCTITGDLAKKIASNFQDLFSIKSIRSIP